MADPYFRPKQPRRWPRWYHESMTKHQAITTITLFIAGGTFGWHYSESTTTALVFAVSFVATGWFAKVCMDR